MMRLHFKANNLGFSSNIEKSCLFGKKMSCSIFIWAKGMKKAQVFELFAITIAAETTLPIFKASIYLTVKNI